MSTDVNVSAEAAECSKMINDLHFVAPTVMREQEDMRRTKQACRWMRERVTVFCRVRDVDRSVLYNKGPLLAYHSRRS